MRFLFLGWILCSAPLLAAEVEVKRLPNGWRLHNDRLQLELERTPSGQIHLSALQHLSSGHEWAAKGTEAGVMLQPSADGGSTGEFRFSTDQIKQLPNGGVELGIASTNAQTGAQLWLLIRGYPSAAVVEYSARLENHGSQSLPLIRRIAPLSISLEAKEPRCYTTAPKGAHGFASVGVLSKTRRFNNWIVLEQGPNTLLVGGDMGAGILAWSVQVEPQPSGVRLQAGSGFPGARGDGPAFEVVPGQVVETPVTFLALSKGDTDDAGNEAFRYLKRFVFLPPAKDSPLAAYCIWFTIPRSEELLLEELQFARRLGFDVFYHDASWYEGSSVVPGMNDWSLGLGSYRESPEKFPNGMRGFSQAVQATGMKFGLWVDPGNVDSSRVASGEIPESWLAKIDGKPLETRHPSLAPMTQLCLGNPAVVAWIKKNLTRIIQDWNIEWIKWDPSGTVSHNCTRTDHGHARRNGAYAAWQGKMEIWACLMERFPSLSGFECDPSLKYSRTNPGPVSLLPGGYQCEFITGPMVSPNVWGSLYSSKTELTGDWHSASALDYDLRKHFMHGFVFGNINGMVSQRLSVAPPGYLEAFQRNLLYFKLYRHLLTQDVYHLKLQSPDNWSAVQYVQADASEAVLFVFRNGGRESQNNLKLRGLDLEAKYRVTRLNERPGRDRILPGKELASQGLGVKLPDEWLARGDALPDPRYEDQLTYGSDVILLRKVN